jgi:hypothetical protein
VRDERGRNIPRSGNGLVALALHGANPIAAHDERGQATAAGASVGPRDRRASVMPTTLTGPRRAQRKNRPPRQRGGR